MRIDGQHATTRCLVQLTVLRPGTEVRVSGRLDVHTVADCREQFAALTAQGTGDLLVHLAEAEVADATGLGVIVGIHHRALLAGRRLVIADTSPRLDRLLRASGLHRVLARADAGPQPSLAPLPSPAAVRSAVGLASH